MSRTVAGKGGSSDLSAVLFGTRELALETMAGITFQIEVGFMSNEPIVYPAGVEFIAV